ncbi:MAG: sigma 54-interacting transcriptional regulator [Planctomycetota bacterium]|jgi:transcriptional regulator with GAF, ATPase, and Fis domain
MVVAKLVVKEGHNRGAVLPLRQDPSRIGRDEGAEIRLFDAEASRDHAVIRSIHEAPTIEDRGSRNGLLVNGVLCERKRLFHGDEIRIGRSVFLFLLDSPASSDRETLPNPAEETVRSPAVGPGEARDGWANRGARFSQGGPVLSGLAADRLVGRSEVIRRVSERIHRAAPTDLPVLVAGESGTGKELVARAVHANSPRRNGPFVAVNAAAIPEPLFESEVFGHEKGAFTDASARRLGRFEEADGGTLFLDEIAETNPSVQAKLLRALEEGAVRRLGSEAPIPVDVRLVAATNRDPAKALKEGSLRADLYYRLKGFEIMLPPLRKRAEDIPLLTEYFFERFREKIHTRLEAVAPEALDRLKAHPWPGNVRELKNALERAMIVAEGNRIECADLPPDLGADLPHGGGEGLPPLQEIERRHIEKALRLAGGNKSRAAALLGIHRKTLYSKMKLHGIQP